MPFGKYRGVALEKIPESYLVWLLDNVALRPTLQREIERVLGVVPEDDGRHAITTDVIGPWYRRLAREFHPDKGGSHEAMKAVNRGRELLAELTSAS